MNKNIAFGILGIIVLAGLGIWYSSSSKSAVGDAATSTISSDTASTSLSAPTNPSKGIANNTATYHSLFAQPGYHQCDFTQVTETSQSNNVVYIGDGKMRAEFRTTSANITVANLMVYVDGYLYVWREGASTGTKTLLRSLADLPQAIPQDLAGGSIISDGTNSVGWNCHAWLRDPKLLAVPSYVKF